MNQPEGSRAAARPWASFVLRTGSAHLDALFGIGFQFVLLCGARDG